MNVPTSALPAYKLDLCKLKQGNVKWYIDLINFCIIDNVIYYCFEICTLRDHEAYITTKLFRYSSLLKLHNHLITTYSSTHKFLPFPPKRLFGNGTHSCGKERMNILRPYILNVITIPNIQQDDEFRLFFDLNVHCSL